MNLYANLPAVVLAMAALAACGKRTDVPQPTTPATPAPTAAASAAPPVHDPSDQKPHPSAAEPTTAAPAPGSGEGATASTDPGKAAKN